MSKNEKSVKSESTGTAAVPAVAYTTTAQERIHRAVFRGFDYFVELPDR